MKEQGFRRLIRRRAVDLASLGLPLPDADRLTLVGPHVDETVTIRQRPALALGRFELAPDGRTRQGLAAGGSAIAAPASIPGRR